MSEVDFARRFGGVRRLYGDAGLERFAGASVAVVGVGGVGSWAAEALARSALGKITLIDLDHVAESNINRQLHAADSTLGKSKVDAMAARLLDINPACAVRTIDDFVTPENVGELLGGDLDVVLDATDQVRAKVAIAGFCRARGLGLVMAGAAGGRRDPTRIRHADLAQVQGDRLLAKVRSLLRRTPDFSRSGSKKFGIACVFSDEQVVRPVAIDCQPATVAGGLSCAGYGSAVCVTAPFGMAAAALVLERLSGRE